MTYWNNHKNPSIIKMLSNIHKDVKRRFVASKMEMSTQQHRCSSPVNIRVEKSVMVKVPDKQTKLAPKFVGPCLVSSGV